MPDFTLDRLPGRCQLNIVTAGPIITVYAEHIDTGATGPLVVLDVTQPDLSWSDLDPDGTVERPPPDE